MVEYTFIPLPFYDENDHQWKPSVKELCNGEFVSWTMFDLGFDEPRFTIPYARQFAQEMAVFRKVTMEHFKTQYGQSH